MRLLLRPLIVILCLVTLISATRAAVFQYAFDYTFENKGKEQTSTVWLWVPPGAEGVKGVVIAGLTSAERRMVSDPAIRAAAAEAGLAIVFTDSGLGRLDVQETLDRFAKASGYEELRHAPIVWLGHSAGGPQAMEKAKAMPDRTLALLQYRGGVPWMGEGEVSSEIPTLVMTGQFDEFGGVMRDAEGNAGWKNIRDDFADKKANGGVPLGTLLIEPGAGHYSFSGKNAEYLAKWIAAVAKQVPEEWPTDRVRVPPTLERLDPSSGWITPLAWGEGDKPQAIEGVNDGKDRVGVGPVNWHPTRELAEATLAYEQGIDKKDQFVGWEDGVYMDAGARPFFNSPKWVDADTFEVHPKYLDKYPSQFNGNGPRWGMAGEAVDHADVPLRVVIGDGPLEMASDDPEERRIQVRFDALNPANSVRKARWIASSSGDDTYRYSEFAGLISRNMQALDKGQEQAMTFPQIEDMKRDAGPVDLAATSDSGLPVRYYVAYGPAEIQDGKLVLNEIPKRAKHPIEVKVVAYQWGSAVDPKVKSAEPVERVFQVVE